MALNIFGQPPEYLSGLLGVDPEKLRKQATTTGLINTALAFAAQPRNQQYGSVLPYAARALMAGQQGAQGVYQGALQDFMTRQKIEDIKRQQQEQQAAKSAMERLAGGMESYTTTTEQPVQTTMYQTAAPTTEAVAPSFDVKPVTTNEIRKIQQVNKQQYNKDLIAAGFGQELIKQQLAPKEVEYLDIGDKLLPVYKTTKQPVEGLEPLSKNLTPEQLQRNMWEQFKYANPSASDLLSADTQRRSQDITVRGQNITMRGQDLQATTSNMPKAPAGYKYKSDGTLEIISGGPADMKSGEKAKGREDFNKVTSSLRKKYEELATIPAAISDPSRKGLGGVFENIGAGMASSVGGQPIGKLFGTKAQSLRNQIESTRPLLLQAIKQATGMSAQQMNSNAEMQMYLNAATNPAYDIETNMNALNMLENLYGIDANNLEKQQIIPRNEQMPPRKVYNSKTGRIE
jgi:hypothetical protein